MNNLPDHLFVSCDMLRMLRMDNVNDWRTDVGLSYRGETEN